MSTFRAFLRDEAGATAVEYGLMAALITLVILTAITTLGSGLTASFNRLSTKLS